MKTKYSFLSDFSFNYITNAFQISPKMSGNKFLFFLFYSLPPQALLSSSFRASFTSLLLSEGAQVGFSSQVATVDAG